jgi:co-chaperonin GroES (HSP10)
MDHVPHEVLAIDWATLRPLRGRAFVEILPEFESELVLLDSPDRERYRGRVLKLGPPAEWPNGRQAEWGCAEGDEVFFVLSVWMDRMRCFPVAGVRGLVAVLAQEEVLGVRVQ